MRKKVKNLENFLKCKYSTESILSFLNDYNKNCEKSSEDIKSAFKMLKSHEKVVVCDEKPFEISSWRDSSLFDQHMIQSARNLIKNFMIFGCFIRILFWLIEFIINNVFQFKRLFGKAFVVPLLKPKKFAYQKPVFYNGNHTKFIFFFENLQILLIFLSNWFSFYANKEIVPYPVYGSFFDYEFELGIVINKKIRNLSVAQIQSDPSIIAGFAIVNDFSERSLQLDEIMNGRLGLHKCKNCANAISKFIFFFFGKILSFCS